MLPELTRALVVKSAVSKVLDRWAYEHGVTMGFSRPGKSTDNAMIESFNGTFRDECLTVDIVA